MENITAVSKDFAIPVEAVGADLEGMQFIESAVTQTITRDGATIALKSSLGLDSELIIRLAGKGEESLARVVGAVRRDSDRYVYAIAIVQPSGDLWGVPFPVATASRIIPIQCGICKSTESVSLLDIELYVLQTKSELSRQCPACRTLTVWSTANRSEGSDSAAAEPSVPAASAASALAADAPVPGKQKTPEGKERRASRRVAVKSFACIRYGGTETQVACEDMSRGGFRFRSSRQFQQDLRIEAAVPYNKSGTNIFMQARIIYCQKLEGGEYRHGVAYSLTKRTPQ